MAISQANGGKSNVSLAALKAIDSTATEDAYKIGDNYFASLDVLANITNANKVTISITNAKTKDGVFTAYLLETKDSGKTYTIVAQQDFTATQTEDLVYTAAKPATAAYSVVTKGTISYFCQIDNIDIQAKAKAD